MLVRDCNPVRPRMLAARARYLMTANIYATEALITEFQRQHSRIRTALRFLKRWRKTRKSQRPTPEAGSEGVPDPGLVAISANLPDFAARSNDPWPANILAAWLKPCPFKLSAKRLNQRFPRIVYTPPLGATKSLWSSGWGFTIVKLLHTLPSLQHG